MFTGTFSVCGDIHNTGRIRSRDLFDSQVIAGEAVQPIQSQRGAAARFLTLNRVYPQGSSQTPRLSFNSRDQTEKQMNSDTFINNLLGETINQIVNGKGNLSPTEQSKLKNGGAFQNANFFTWCTPGIPVMPEDFAFLKGLRPLDSEKWKGLSEAEREDKKGTAAYNLTVAMDNFSVLIDTVPNKSGAVNSLQVWEPQNRISHIYESVLKNCEVADTIPSPDAQERINKIRAALVNTVEGVDDNGEKFKEERPSKMIVAYQKFQKEYSDAFMDYVTFMSKAISGSAADVQMVSMFGPQKYKTVTTALDNWEAQGFKTQYEKMMADLSQLEGVSMSLLLKEYTEIFERSRRTSLLDSGDYSVSRLVPGSFYESGGWTQFSFSSSQLKKTDLTKTQKYSGGARFGFFGGASGGHKRLDTSNKMNFEGATIAFELTQVPIVRTWFREDFLMSSKWRPKTQANGNSTLNPGEILSNGDPANPQGKLFAYPTVIIFVRNIRVTKSLYDQMSTEANRESGGSGGFSLGPFSMGASASQNKTQRTLKIDKVNDSIVVDGTQIAGFRNEVLRMCPNPDPTIKHWI